MLKLALALTMESSNPSLEQPATTVSSSSVLSRIVFGRNPKRTLIRATVLAVVCLVVFKYILLPIKIDGPSMMPTYKEKGINFVNRLAYLRHEPQRGDVVAVRFTGPHVMLMKRIVGLPGETISFRHGKLYVNGEPQNEPYVKFPCDWDRRPRVLSADEFFVVGDNRSMDIDLHVHGAAERKRILGKILL